MATPTLDAYITHVTYGAEGFVMGGVNGLLLATFLWDKLLRQRKEMLLIAGLAGADFLFGFSSVLSAAYRITILALGLQNEAFTARQCALLPQMFLPYISMSLVSVMSLLVSIDRYISVAYPLKYHVTNIGFTKKILLLVGLFGIFLLLLMFASTYFGMPADLNVHLLCYANIWPSWFLIGVFSFIASVGFLAVIVYGFVFAAFKASVRNRVVPLNSNRAVPEESTIQPTVNSVQMMPANNHSTSPTPTNHLTTITRQVVTNYGVASNNSHNRREHKQHRLTVTLGIVNINTLLFYVAPLIAVSFLMYRQTSIPTLILWLMTMTRISPIVNVAVYLYRQNEIRKSMLRLITCSICRPPP